MFGSIWTWLCLIVGIWIAFGLVRSLITGSRGGAGSADMGVDQGLATAATEEVRIWRRYGGGGGGAHQILGGLFGQRPGHTLRPIFPFRHFVRPVRGHGDHTGVGQRVALAVNRRTPIGLELVIPARAIREANTVERRFRRTVRQTPAAVLLVAVAVISARRWNRGPGWGGDFGAAEAGFSAVGR